MHNLVSDQIFSKDVLQDKDVEDSDFSPLSLKDTRMVSAPHSAEHSANNVSPDPVNSKEMNLVPVTVAQGSFTPPKRRARGAASKLSQESMPLGQKKSIIASAEVARQPRRSP